MSSQDMYYIQSRGSQIRVNKQKKYPKFRVGNRLNILRYNLDISDPETKLEEQATVSVPRKKTG